MISPLTPVLAEERPAEAQDITVLLDGEEVPVTNAWQDNRLYAPISQLAKLFGAQIRWDSKNDEVTLVTALRWSISMTHDTCCPQDAVYFYNPKVTKASSGPA